MKHVYRLLVGVVFATAIVGVAQAVHRWPKTVGLIVDVVLGLAGVYGLGLGIIGLLEGSKEKERSK